MAKVAWLPRIRAGFRANVSSSMDLRGTVKKEAPPRFRSGASGKRMLQNWFIEPPPQMWLVSLPLEYSIDKVHWASSDFQKLPG